MGLFPIFLLRVHFRIITSPCLTQHYILQVTISKSNHTGSFIELLAALLRLAISVPRYEVIADRSLPYLGINHLRTVSQRTTVLNFAALFRKYHYAAKSEQIPAVHLFDYRLWTPRPVSRRRTRSRTSWQVFVSFVHIGILI